MWGGESSRISIVLNGAIVSTVQNFFRLLTYAFLTFRFLLVSYVSLAGLVLEVSASFLGMGHTHVSATNQLESTTHHCFWVNNSLKDTLKKRCATLLGGPFRCCYLWTCGCVYYTPLCYKSPSCLSEPDSHKAPWFPEFCPVKRSV